MPLFEIQNQLPWEVDRQIMITNHTHTVELLKNQIRERIPPERPFEVQFEGLQQKLSDNAFVLAHFPKGGKIRLVLVTDEERQTQEKESRERDSLGEDVFNIHKNVALKKSEQVNLIKLTQRPDRGVKAEVEENKADDEARQRNVVADVTIKSKDIFTFN
ncbi:hypothetical protein DL770_001417 [Monosporascus sp. CRB-9-2]|nr:hypothetical protein DL770_001417 [Monosporascus sp. CRB-9-2]